MTRSLLLLTLAAFAAPGWAAPGLDLDEDGIAWARDDDKKKKDDLPERSGPRDLGEEPEEEFDLLSDEADEAEPPEFFGDVSDDDDFSLGFEDAAPKKTTSAPAPAGPGPITLDVAGMEPLGDNYPVQVVAVDRDAVVIELPVLVGRSRVGLDQPFAVVADAYVGETKVGSVTAPVTRESLAEFGPSFVFVKLLTPVVEKEGEVTLKVHRAKADGSGKTLLFTRATPYALP